MEAISLSNFDDLDKEKLINRDTIYTDHNDGSRWYFEYVYFFPGRRSYKAIKTSAPNGEPIMNADWKKVNF